MIHGSDTTIESDGSDASNASNAKIESDVLTLYEKYTTLLLNEAKYGSKVPMVQDIATNSRITIPYNILKHASEYSQYNINPLTLYYLVINRYIVQYIKEDSKQAFLQINVFRFV